MAVVFTNPIMLLIPLVSLAALAGSLGAAGPRTSRKSTRDNDPAALALRSAGPGLWGRQRTDGAVISHVLGITITPGETVCVVGPPALAQRVAALALLEVATSYSPAELRVAVAADASRQWAWVRWLPHRVRAVGVSLSALTPADTTSGTARTQGSSDEAPVSLLIAGPAPGKPTQPARGWAALHVSTTPLAHASRTIAVGAIQRGRLDIARIQADGTRRSRRVRPASAELCEAAARRLAAHGPQEHMTQTLRELEGAPHAAAIARRWQRDEGATVVGTTLNGHPFSLDLDADGPHMLVGGTTGSGKSQLLRTLVLSCALRYPPDGLTVVALDHKGGATFADLATLPHMAALVTDLDKDAAVRALTSLGAELRRREQLLAHHQCVDRRALLKVGVRLPRLVVIVDEFRALADDLPDFVPELVRLAAQGRSLGMHLVLATQRPGGAVSPDMRANISGRIACRVADPADSHDLIGTADAAYLPSHCPGSALVRTGAGLSQIRVALGDALTSTAVNRCHWPESWDTTTPLDERDRELSRDIAQAAQALGLARATPLWLEPLPAKVCVSSLAQQDPGTIPMALGDVPQTQSREVMSWDPRQGHLLVVGAPGSGLTTAARTAAAGALTAGWHVHLLAADPAPYADLAHHPLVGTIVGLDDPRRLARLVAALEHRGHRAVVIIDGADAFLSVNCPSSQVLRETWMSPAGTGPALVACGSVALTAGRHSTAFPTRIILPTADPTDDMAAGVPREMATARSQPGRAIWRGRTRSVLCQVAVASDPIAPASGRGAPPALRLEPIPLEVSVDQLPPATPRRIPIGIGGDCATAQWVDLTPGAAFTVAGRPGSGRTSLLHLIAGALAPDLGPPVWIDQRNPMWATLLEEGLAKGAVVLIDDLDPAQPAPATLPDRGVLIAACSLSHVVNGARGLLAHLTRTRTGVILGAPSPASAPVLGVDVRAHLDVLRPGHPGRGVLIDSEGPRPLQCAKSR